MATLSNGLTDSDQRRCSEIANVIWNDSNTATIQNGFGIMLTLVDLTSLQTDFATRIAALTAASVLEIQTTILPAWDKVRLSDGEMEAGSVGDLTGLKYSFEGKRQQIKRVFCGYVPCLGMAQAQARKNDKTVKPSTVIEIARG